jgi:hypothetical protein
MNESMSSIPRAMRISSSGWHRNITPPRGPDRAHCQLLNEEFVVGDENESLLHGIAVLTRASQSLRGH